MSQDSLALRVMLIIATGLFGMPAVFSYYDEYMTGAAFLGAVSVLSTAAWIKTAVRHAFDEDDVY